MRKNKNQNREIRGDIITDMTCDTLVYNRLLNRKMLTDEEQRRKEEIKEVAEEILHTNEGQEYNPKAGKMSDKELAEILVLIRQRLQLKKKVRVKVLAGIK
jgi:hypothetical protein